MLFPTVLFGSDTINLLPKNQNLGRELSSKKINYIFSLKTSYACHAGGMLPVGWSTRTLYVPIRSAVDTSEKMFVIRVRDI